MRPVTVQNIEDNISSVFKIYKGFSKNLVFCHVYKRYDKVFKKYKGFFENLVLCHLYDGYDKGNLITDGSFHIFNVPIAP